MTSIESLIKEVYEAIDLHSEGKLSPTYCLIKIVEAKCKAIELYNKEISTIRLDFAKREEIDKSNVYGITLVGGSGGNYEELPPYINLIEGTDIIYHGERYTVTEVNKTFKEIILHKTCLIDKL
jgi:hypothetical protein